MSDGHRVPRWLKFPALAVLAVLLGDLLASQLVRAASEEAWDALVREASAACQMASDLEQPRVVEQSGLPAPGGAAHHRQVAADPHEGKQGYMLCLFDKQTARSRSKSRGPAVQVAGAPAACRTRARQRPQMRGSRAAAGHACAVAIRSADQPSARP
jgi:hypothetical protein